MVDLDLQSHESSDHDLDTWKRSRSFSSKDRVEMDGKAIALPPVLTRLVKILICIVEQGLRRGLI